MGSLHVGNDRVPTTRMSSGRSTNEATQSYSPILQSGKPADGWFSIEESSWTLSRKVEHVAQHGAITVRGLHDKIKICRRAVAPESTRPLISKDPLFPGPNIRISIVIHTRDGVFLSRGLHDSSGHLTFLHRHFLRVPVLGSQCLDGIRPRHAGRLGCQSFICGFLNFQTKLSVDIWSCLCFRGEAGFVLGMTSLLGMAP